MMEQSRATMAHGLCYGSIERLARSITCASDLIPKIAAVIIGMAFASAAVAEPDFTARNGGPSGSAMVARNGPSPAPGLAFVRPVLTGVLYRAGFKGGDKGRTGLSETQRQDLCDAGFSSARYIDFGKNTSFGSTSCAKGTMSYAPGSSTKPHDVMVQLHDIVENPGKGPMLVHCMWGVHSSGAVAAMALMQFCGWSESDAKAYWNEARNGADCAGGCDVWIDKHFASFKLDPSLQLTAAQRAEICPK